jgi:hypothetical protein
VEIRARTSSHHDLIVGPVGAHERQTGRGSLPDGSAKASSCINPALKARFSGAVFATVYEVFRRPSAQRAGFCATPLAGLCAAVDKRSSTLWPTLFLRKHSGPSNAENVIGSALPESAVPARPASLLSGKRPSLQKSEKILSLSHRSLFPMGSAAHVFVAEGLCAPMPSLGAGHRPDAALEMPRLAPQRGAGAHRSGRRPSWNRARTECSAANTRRHAARFSR